MDGCNIDTKNEGQGEKQGTQKTRGKATRRVTKDEGRATRKKKQKKRAGLYRLVM